MEQQLRLRMSTAAISRTLLLTSQDVSVTITQTDENTYDLSAQDLTADDIKTLYESNADTNAFTDAEKTKLANLTSAYKGFFADDTALRAAYPTASNGDYATVGSTDTIWTWDSDTVDWVNTDSNSQGDMLRSTYDPTNIASDAFDMDNMVEGTTNKILTSAERAAIAGALPTLLDIKGPSGAYSLLTGDNGYLVVIDNNLTVPIALPTGFQCAVFNSTAAAVTLTTTGNTVPGDPLTQIDAYGLITVTVIASNTVLIKGEAS